MKTPTLRILRSALLSLALLGGSLSGLPAFAANRVTGFDEAARLAQARVPNGRVDSVERETHHGREIFEVEIHTPDGCEHKVILAADDGSIIREKRECD